MIALPERDHQILVEELRIISTAITDLDHKSTQVKQWCVAFFTAAWGVEFSNLEISTFWVILIILLAFFWIDVQVKRNQRKFLFRSRELHWWLNSNDSDPRPPNIGETLRIFDPASGNSSHVFSDDYKDEYQNFIGYKRTIASSLTLLSFYGALLFLFFAVEAGLLVVDRITATPLAGC